ncbi:MAG TPA: TlpA disulfide reductase family protein [Bacteroidales bacterium]|nr:TlpA disulfide reductase family protein [Bacteroidales bacterium]
MKRVLFILALVVIFSGCRDKDSFTVDGIVKGRKEKYIYLNRLDVNTAVFLDSAKIKRSGHFSFRVKASYPDFYQLGFSKSDFITLLAGPGEEISLNFKGKTLYDDYTIKGSKGTEKLQYLDNTLAVTKRKLDSLRTEYNNASKQPGFDKKGPELKEQFNNLIKQQRRKNIEFIINNVNSLASIKALYQRIDPQTYVLYDPKDLQFLKIVTDSLTRHYPNSRHVQALARDFTNEMNQMYVNRLENMAKDVPTTKLDPNLKDIDNKRIALSSLKGKYVLLCFWSAQSQDCVNENLQLKQLYKQYHSKGFEIYQINLDKDTEAWKTAVRYDELPWINTREDDPSNPKNAILFNIKSLPANYLFDRQGTIIASNLHGKSLQIKLNQLFN